MNINKFTNFGLRFSMVYCLLFGFLGEPQKVTNLVIDPTGWQNSAVGLMTTQNSDHKTAGIGLTVQANGWPFISLSGGVKGTDWGKLAESGGIELGTIKIPGNDPVNLTSENSDWTHDGMTFTGGAGAQLKLTVSRLTPAALIETSASRLQLFAGIVVGNTFNGTSVSVRPTGPAFPKYMAYESGGVVKIQSLSSTATTISTLDKKWLLIWYGNNSHFVDTKKPTDFTGSEFNVSSLLQSNAYQADSPFLLILQNQPATIKQSSEGGVELGFSSQVGSLGLLPLFGRDHLVVSQTEAWSHGLPSNLLTNARWWQDHLCSFPIAANETYSYNPQQDLVTFTENISFQTVCSGGKLFAPIPSMLAIAKNEMNIAFSGPVVDGNLNTEFGPSNGIENVNSYTWGVAGFKKYSDSKRVVTNTGQAPGDLELNLDSEVQKIISDGHYAPWIFTDSAPRYDYWGDIYWLNPADVIYQLTEIAPAVKNTQLKYDFINFIKSERNAYPPEDIYNLPLDVGTVRGSFSVSGSDVISRRQSYQPDEFLKRVPLYNYYALARYYDLTGETPSSALWQKAQTVLDAESKEQDWATLYWFQGYDERPVAVVNANRNFAGLVGFVNLSEKMGDTASETLGRALLIKAAVRRIGMAMYPRYLYSSGLTNLPAQPDWQVRYSAGTWVGYIFNYEWSGPYDDARQVLKMNQFGVTLHDNSGKWGLLANIQSWWTQISSSYLIAFRDLVPENARFLSDFAQQDVDIYINKVTKISPTWYIAFSEATLGAEHNLNHPIDSFQIFMAKSLIQKTDPQTLTGYLDIPWLGSGDLFYMQKLAEVVKSYRGLEWNDTLKLSGNAQDHIIYLQWQVFSNLPLDTSFRIDYSGPSGNNPSPIEGISGLNRTYVLTGLTNSAVYSIKISAWSGTTKLLESNQVQLSPNRYQFYVPNIDK